MSCGERTVRDLNVSREFHPINWERQVYLLGLAGK